METTRRIFESIIYLYGDGRLASRSMERKRIENTIKRMKKAIIICYGEAGIAIAIVDHRSRHSDILRVVSTTKVTGLVRKTQIFDRLLID